MHDSIVIITTKWMKLHRIEKTSLMVEKSYARWKVQGRPVQNKVQRVKMSIGFREDYCSNVLFNKGQEAICTKSN